MPINIVNPDLDKALDDLASAQPARTSRVALAEAILGRATEAYRASGDPLAWTTANSSHQGSGNNDQPANTSMQTDQVPAQQVEHREVNDAAQVNPPSGTESPKGCSPDETLAESA